MRRVSEAVSWSSGTRLGTRRMRGMRGLFAGIVFIVVVLLVVFQAYLRHLRFLVDPHTRWNRSTRLILMWASISGTGGRLPPTLDKFGCKVKECRITYDHSLAPSSSAILFPWKEVDLSDLPSPRPYGQLWLVFGKEPPHHTRKHILDGLLTLVNWTITYRRDSDFRAPYGRLVSGSYKSPKDAKFAKKNKLVAWLVSNCKTEGKRENYVRELSRYIPVDVYGKCGKPLCTRIHRSNCYQMLGERYKFYLAFENSMCKDYVTEKAYYPLTSGMIPVVFGGGEYSKELPPNSYVHALNFSSPRELARYLLRVANDSALYQSYFKWTKRYRVELKPFSWLCELCEKLHEENVEVSHRNVFDWWYKESECKTWDAGKIVPV